MSDRIKRSRCEISFVIIKNSYFFLNQPGQLMN